MNSSRVIIISTILFLSQIVFSKKTIAQYKANYRYEVERVLPDIYILKPIINQYRWVTANIIVLVNDSDVVVVDSGLLPAAAIEAIKEIKKITDKPIRYLINTHWHGDHWQGNDAFATAFPNIDIISTEQAKKGMARNGLVWAKQFYFKHFNNYLKDFENSLKEKSIDGKPLSQPQMMELQTGIVQMNEDLADLKNLKLVLPTITFSENLILQKGAREIQILYLGIGNTSGDGVIYLPKEKVVITGDLVVYPSPFESGMFSPEWLETSKKLSLLDFQYLLPGHGEVQRDKKYIFYLNALFEEIIKQVSEAYSQGNSKLEDVKLRVTHQTVTDKLNLVPEYKTFTNQLDQEFVPAAIQTSYKRIIQGKQ